MDIRQIVEETIIEPARMQAIEMQFADNLQRIEDIMNRKDREIVRLLGLVNWYREKNADHERMVGELHKLLKVDDLDAARDIVSAAFDGIHGPTG
jgi:hypothetical protein